MKKNRREFIKYTGLMGLALGTTSIKRNLGEMISGNTLENKIVFLSPIDGG